MTTFPRKDDGLGWAWGLACATPTKVWERFSPAYEAQAQDVLTAFEGLGLTAALDFAGGQDGEAALGRNAAGDLVILLHLEDPVEAELIERARRGGALQAHIKALMS